MNIIYDNIVFSIQRSGGGSVYWYELIKRLIKTSNDILFLEQRKDSNIFRAELNLEKSKKSGIFPLRVNMYLPIIRIMKNKTIFHSSYYRYILSKNVINITTVHDFTPEYFSKGLVRYVNFLLKKNAIKNSDGIICISENTKKDLLKFHPTALKKDITVIYNGVSESFFKVQDIENEISKISDDEVKICCEKSFILYVGHRTNYKNFNLAVQTVKLFKGNLHFVIVGEPLKKDEEIFVNSNLNIDQYTVLSRKNNELLNLLYNKAFCFIYPTSYEGFGIPILEAMKAGCPVITSNKSSIPEVAGVAAIMVDNLSVNDFYKAVNSLFDSDFRSSLIQNGYIQASKFSWDKTFNEVLKFYQRLYDQK